MTAASQREVGSEHTDLFPRDETTETRNSEMLQHYLADATKPSVQGRLVTGEAAPEVETCEAEKYSLLKELDQQLQSTHEQTEQQQ